MPRTVFSKARSLPALSAPRVGSGPPEDGRVQRISRIALLPAIVVGLVMAATLGGLQTRQTGHVAQPDAQATAEWVALAAAPSLLHDDRAGLARLVESAGSRATPPAQRILIVSAAGEVLAAAGDDGASPRWRQHGEAVVTDAAGRRIGSVVAKSERVGVTAMLRSDMLIAFALLLLSMAAAVVLARAGANAAMASEAPGEVRRQEDGIDAAAAALREARRDMRRQVERATRELERKNAALEASRLTRARFLAAASHDLRQPLSALTLFSSALSVGEKDPVRLSRIDHIRECVNSLDHLFNSLLDLSRLEAGAMSPSMCDLPLDALFDEVSRTFRMSAEQRKLRLIVRRTDAYVRCDRVMLSRILNNLVCNAIRYTESGGVLVAARRRGAMIRIDVWDTGPGIAPELQDRVFEEFFQAHATRSTMHGRRGLGLGLSTVRRLCELHEIPVYLKSRQQRGTVFSVEVPLCANAMPDVAEAASPAPPDISGLRVMVIEDEPTILEGLQILMESWGCRVGTAANADQALELARSWPQPPDIIVSDLRLGAGQSGVEVIRMLQRHYHAQGAGGFGRLLITGETSRERLREICAARIPVLHKPVTPERLREAMVAMAGVRRLAA